MWLAGGRGARTGTTGLLFGTSPPSLPPAQDLSGQLPSLVPSGHIWISCEQKAYSGVWGRLGVWGPGPSPQAGWSGAGAWQGRQGWPLGFLI